MRLSSTAASVLVFGMLGISSAVSAAPVHRAIFKDGASSTGWIDFDFQDGKHIFIPAKVNGHDTMVLLATGLPTPDIDKAFATSIGLQPMGGSKIARTGGGDTAGLIPGLHIQIGNLILQDTDASVVDFAPLAKHMGHPLPLLLGDDAFNNLVVDIDFANHRIAFREHSKQTIPTGAVKVPLVRAEGEHLVPVSIEGAPPTRFELGLGNSGDMLVYQSYYQAHDLLAGRRTSKRMGGGSGGFIPETIATLRSAEFAGITFFNMPAAFIPASQTGATSNVISGDIGLPILTRFRLIIDYPNDLLYAVPYADAVQAPFAKDRLGLFMNKEDTDFAVRFVAPNGPAQAAGFKVGDKITLIDGKSAQAWPETVFADLRYGASGTNLVFTMKGGGVRRVKLADYF